MSDALHPLAAHHLPPFITPPGETDVLMIAVIFFLLAIILAIGLLYLRLHALPEHMAHRANVVQFEIVAVLALLALFTHNHVYWVAALLLAMVRIPDVWTPLAMIAEAQQKIASRLRPAAEEGTSPVDALPPSIEPGADPGRSPVEGSSGPHAREPRERNALVPQDERV